MMMSRSSISQLEQEWAHHKYAVLEKDPAAYQKIRTLLKQKQDPDVSQIRSLIKEAYLQEANEGRENNALLHVWGYFKHCATPEEKAVFEEKHSLWLSHKGSLLDLKRELYALSIKYDQVYLLNSSYFDTIR